MSAVIVTYNHEKTIVDCLQAARAELPAECPILVLDNGSKDQTVKLAQAQNGVLVVSTGANLGFSAAMNRGLLAARSEYVLALGPDVLLQPGFYSAIRAAWKPGVAMVGGFLLELDAPERIDDAGTIATHGKQFKSRGSGELDRGQFQDGDILAVCGGCCLFRRDALDDLLLLGELYDEDFFAYKEDIDLGWRAHLLGWTCRFASQARALHARQGGREASSFLFQLSVRNRLWMLIKNEDWTTALLHLPELVAFELYQLYCHGRSYRPWQLLRLLPKMWKKRRTLHQRRRLTPKQMRQRWRRLQKALPIDSQAGVENRGRIR